MFEAGKKQVLLVDGDAENIKKLSLVLEESGVDVLTAVSSDGAIQKAQALDLNMILVGDEVPGSSGAEICHRLRNNPRTQHIPIIMLTGDAPSAVFLKGYRAGADDCLHQEVDKEELLGRMDVLWRRGNSSVKIVQKDPQREVVREISKIIDEGLIKPYFQPIYYLNPFRFFGVELLSRPVAGSFFSNTEEMFRAAINHDLYYSLEMLCLQKALDIVVVAAKNEQFLFNCSPYLIQHPKFQSIMDVFSRSKIPFNKIVLEIKGRTAISDYHVFVRHLSQYRNLGFSLSVDEAGAGYESLKSIALMKPEVIKISSAIVRNVHLEPLKQDLIKFIVTFCRGSKSVTIAEKVECREEMDMLVALGIDAVQGYYLSRPTDKLNIRQMKDLCVDFF